MSAILTRVCRTAAIVNCKTDQQEEYYFKKTSNSSFHIVSIVILTHVLLIWLPVNHILRDHQTHCIIVVVLITTIGNS